MEITEYKIKRNEIVKHLYRSGEHIGIIASRLAIDTNLVRDIVGLERPIPNKDTVLSVIKHEAY